MVIGLGAARLIEERASGKASLMGRQCASGPSELCVLMLRADTHTHTRRYPSDSHRHACATIYTAQYSRRDGLASALAPQARTVGCAQRSRRRACARWPFMHEHGMFGDTLRVGGLVKETWPIVSGIRGVNGCRALTVVGGSGQDARCARSPSERGVRGGHFLGGECSCDLVFGVSLAPASLCGESEG